MKHITDWYQIWKALITMFGFNRKNKKKSNSIWKAFGMLLKRWCRNKQKCKVKHFLYRKLVMNWQAVLYLLMKTNTIVMCLAKAEYDTAEESIEAENAKENWYNSWNFKMKRVVVILLTIKLWS